MILLPYAYINYMHYNILFYCLIAEKLEQIFSFIAVSEKREVIGYSLINQ